MQFGLLISGLALLGITLIIRGTMLFIQLKKMETEAMRILELSGPSIAAHEISLVLKSVRLLAKRPEGLLKVVEFVIKNNIEGKDAIFVLESYLKNSEINKDNAQFASYLAGFYFANNQNVQAQRILDFVVLQKMANQDDIDCRVRIAMEDVDVSDYAISVCEESRSSTKDSGLYTYLSGYLAQYYALSLLVPGRSQEIMIGLASRGLILFDELRRQNPSELSYYFNIVRCRYLLSDYEKCHLECKNSRHLFGDFILEEVSVMWAESFLKLYSKTEFMCDALTKTSSDAGLNVNELCKVFEKAYGDTEGPGFVGPLASLYAYLKRIDERALNVYLQAVSLNEAETSVLQLFHEQLIRLEKWDDAISVGMILIQKDVENLEWNKSVANCLLQRGNFKLTEEQIRVVKRVSHLLSGNPDYQKMIMHILLQQKDWEDSDLAHAIKIESLIDDAQQLRESILQKILKLDEESVILKLENIFPIFNRWWNEGGRSEEIIVRMIPILIKNVPEDSLLPVAIEWEISIGRVVPEHCAILLRIYQRLNRPHSDIEAVASVLETFWKEKSDFDASDTDALFELRRSGFRPEIESYKKCISFLLKEQVLEKVMELFGEFLDVGYFDHEFIIRMLSEKIVKSDSDIEDKALWSLLNHGNEIFPSALRLLRKHGSDEEKYYDSVRLKAKLVDEFNVPEISEKQRYSAWKVLDSYLIRKINADMTEKERKVLLYAIGQNLIDFSSEPHQIACNELCRVLLNIDRDEGLNLALRLTGLKILTPETALQVLKVA